MKYKHIMIDIETLGTNPQSPIIQIGACAFNYTEVGPSFAALVQPDFHLTKPDLATIAWWMEQNDAARKHMAKCLDQGFTEYSALNELCNFYNTHAEHDACTWALPPQFDLVILEHTMRNVGLNPPWNHKRTRCLRTLEDLAHGIKEDREVATTVHDAGADARAQALTAMKYMQKIEAHSWQ